MIRINKYALSPISSVSKKCKDPYVLVLLWQIILCVVVLGSALVVRQVAPPQWEALKTLLCQQLIADKQITSVQVVQSAKAAVEDLKGTLDALIQESSAGTEEAAEAASSKLYFVNNVFPAQGILEGVGGSGTPENCTYSPILLSVFLQSPVSGRVTSVYGWRTHPITEKEDFHRGIDIAVPMGTPIRAVLPGQVVEVGESPIYGNFLRLSHGTGMETIYSHCDEIKARQGEVLRKGELLATAGNTGISTGPHVHFELLVNGLYYDPAWVMNGLTKHGD